MPQKKKIKKKRKQTTLLPVQRDQKERYFKADQEDLQKKIELRKAVLPNDNFEFHPYATYGKEEEKRPEIDDGENGSESEQEDEDMVKTLQKGSCL